MVIAPTSMVMSDDVDEGGHAYFGSFYPNLS